MKSMISGLTERLKRRMSFATAAFVLFFIVAVGSLFLIKIVNGAKYTIVTERRSSSSTIISAKRGDIMDRNNVLLATSTIQYKLILDPAVMLEDGRNYLDITSRLIEKCFGIPAETVREKVSQNSRSHYLNLRDDEGKVVYYDYNQVKDFMEMLEADSAAIKQFLELESDYKEVIEAAGAWLEESFKRNYTYGTFAASVLGFTENGNGSYGIEKYYNEALSGIDGIRSSYLSDENVIERVYQAPEDGYTLQATIDYNIQSVVERLMMDMLDETGANTIAVLVQDPDSGEILAMADTNIFDPNKPRDLSVRYSEYEIENMSDEETLSALTRNWNNFCVSDSFEPGSTFKCFTVAGGLESGSISKDQYFDCDGSRDIRDYTIHCAKLDGHGHISLTDALADSCNLAMMDIAEAEDIDIFTKYQSQFGFGSLTEIDLPHEISCRSLMYTIENMTDIDLATNSFGQTFNTTMIQLSTAFCTLINGGIYYEPYVVKGMYNSDGDLVVSHEKTVVSKPISADTGAFIKKALRHVVTDGTGTSAAVPGYITAGKTGTAQKGKRQDDLWVASFIGFAPYDNPEVVCYVVIDEPEDGSDGSSVYACQLFSQIMAEILPYLNAKTADQDSDPTGQGSPFEEETQDYEWNGEEGGYLDWEDYLAHTEGVETNEEDNPYDDYAYGYNGDYGYGYEDSYEEEWY